MRLVSTSICLRFALSLLALSAIPAAHAEANRLLFDLAEVGTAAGKVTRVYGSTGDGSRGVPVAGGHDCDGDNHPDYAFSAIQASPLGRTLAGEVALVFGDGTIGGDIDSAGFPDGVLKIAGAQTREIAGNEIWIDDISGDGLGDLIVCRQNYTPATGREGAGAVTILIGGSALRTEAEKNQYFDLDDPSSAVTLFTIVGDKAYDRLGIWARTGDIDGDGTADLIVGADEVDGEGLLVSDNRGAIYVFRGGSHFNATQTVDLQDFGSTALAGHVARIDPPPGSSNYHFGATCFVGDIDGNGRGEVLGAAVLFRSGAGLALAGAPGGTGESSGGPPRGSAFIAWDDNFPPTAWDSGYTIDLSGPSAGSATRIDGGSGNDHFGEELLSGLDYNGDGNLDLFVGDISADTVNGIFSGSGHVIFNAAATKGLEFNIDNPPPGVSVTDILGPIASAIGGDTATHGDYDGDGIGDLVFGNPHDRPQGRISAGSMHVLYGRTGSWPSTISLKSGDLPSSSEMRIAQIDGALGTNGSDSGDTLCYSAAAGDIDGDGITDIIVNEMVGNGVEPSAEDVGNLLVISGAALLPPPTYYEDWSATEFDGGETETARTDDPDSDGFNNEKEFLFALDPESGADSGNLPAVAQLDGSIVITYTRTRNIGLVEWRYSTSTDLSTWENAVLDTDLEERSVTDNGDGAETVEVALLAPLTGSEVRFVRVEAVLGN